MIKIVLPLVAASLLAVGCAANGSPSPAPAPPVTSGPGANAASAPGATSALGGTSPAAPAVPADSSQGAVTTGVSVRPWTTGTTTVRHTPKVPPVPVVTRVRYAAHAAEGFDRVVLDISGGLPGYTARYVSEVRQDGSGNRVYVPGAYDLLLVLNPAQAHTESGAATVRGLHRTDLRMLESYAIVGDYEGYVSIALGLNGKKGYRVGELSGRVYIDVRR